MQGKTENQILNFHGEKLTVHKRRCSCVSLLLRGWGEREKEETPKEMAKTADGIQDPGGMEQEPADFFVLS